MVEGKRKSPIGKHIHVKGILMKELSVIGANSPTAGTEKPKPRVGPSVLWDANHWVMKKKKKKRKPTG